ncbi:MoxR family ATPase [Aliiglaciecola sp. 3_MG-2023]|uniref:AAA family ATPase n=1 Tax=Aliiglaciecola sp. 3_MG-2023 TaxID=3062644 RepID=UPI0026E23C44|nr:MoxR family ATPase [Aliiglaciecola sp. 3_MG-2023]MDO6692013.1 MoxR family ATPase [Aliiglaciecola sp. 3_MG-2023]
MNDAELESNPSPDITAEETIVGGQTESLIDQQTLNQAYGQIDALKNNVQRLLIGQNDVVEQVIIAFLAGGHVLLEGVPGLGKTLLIRALAKSIDLDYKRVQFTPDLMPADVTGHSMLDMATGKFALRKGPAFTHLLLADEINRAPAKTQAALLEVMQEYQITIDGQSMPLETPFMVLATQNPIDNEGTYPLPEAELDRFMLKVLVSYPEHQDEITLTKLNTENQTGVVNASIQSVLSKEDALGLKALVSRVLIDDKVVDYAVGLVRATREWDGIVHGAGIRASIALVQAAKVKALCEGQGFVTPDHIKAMLLPVLRHRIILSAEREISGSSAEQVLSEIIQQAASPRQ